MRKIYPSEEYIAYAVITAYFAVSVVVAAALS